MAKDFKQGVLVWAKMKGFPPWPAKVAFPTDGKSPKSKKPQHYVFFFGTHDFAWILDQNIVPHSEEMLEIAKTYKKLSSTMLNAIQEIERASQKGRKKSKLLMKDKVKEEPVSSPPPPPLEDTPVPEKPKKSKKKPVPKKKIKGEKKSPKKRSASVVSNDFDIDVKIKKDEDSDEDYSLLIANVPPNNGYSNVAVIPPYSDDSKPSIFLNGSVFESVAPSLSPFKTPKTESFIPTDKKIGFLGLGVMGCELVKRLLSSRHNVTIWNRRIVDAYNVFVEAGAKTARNPAEVIQECDITFCCVSDPEAVKSVVFGSNGVLAGLDELCSNKAYVEMSTIDPITSQEISEAIAGKGGRYLEAPMIGSRQDVDRNTMVILAAGDRGIFTDCSTVFAAWSRHAFHLGCVVGTANKMSLCLNMLAGTTYAALGESLALVKECDISPAFFMEIIGVGPVNFPLLLRKGHSMITNDQTVYTPIRNQQKDMSLALSLGHTSQQPLSLSVQANEIYKRAVEQDGESDVSAIRKWLK